MHLDVAFTPSELDAKTPAVCIVVDVIRATTTIATMFAQGASTVYVARTLESGRAFARAHGFILCGEVGGARPPGFDYGNSPREITQLDLHGRVCVLCTTNGTVALHAVNASEAAFVGALVNAGSVIRQAMQSLPSQRLTVVCSGRSGAFAFDDAYCAGVLIAEALTVAPHAALSDTATAAVSMARGWSSPLQALRASLSASSLEPLGLAGDVAFAAQHNLFDIAPRLVRSPTDARHPVVLVTES